MRKIAILAIVAASMIGVPAVASPASPTASGPRPVLVCVMTSRGLRCVDIVLP